VSDSKTQASPSLCFCLPRREHVHHCIIFIIGTQEVSRLSNVGVLHPHIQSPTCEGVAFVALGGAGFSSSSSSSLESRLMPSRISSRLFLPGCCTVFPLPASSFPATSSASRPVPFHLCLSVALHSTYTLDMHYWTREFTYESCKLVVCCKEQ